MDIGAISKHLYNETVNKAVKYVKSLVNEEELAVYINNYNWDEGFEVPEAVLSNENCTKSVALRVFELADGMTYLESKSDCTGLEDWTEFISKLYHRIITGDFKKGEVAFKPDLTKLQLYKLKKVLQEDELIFITEIEGKECNIMI